MRTQPDNVDSGRRRVIIGLASLGAAVCGCATKPKTPPATPTSRPESGGPLSSTDPCASRMHDICGAFLLFYFYNARLPKDLRELREMPSDEPLTLDCPVSGNPYIYTPDGIQIPERSTRIILYDPSPAHRQMRWTINIEEPEPGKPLQTKVLALPESFFLVRPPRV